MTNDPRLLREGFGSLIARAARQWRRSVDRRLQPFGLTEATWLPLIHIARARQPMRQKDLAASLVLDGSSVVRLLDALESAGLIERREESRGLEVIEQVEAASREVRSATLVGLSEQDIASATRILDIVCTNLAAELDRDA